MNMKKKLIIVPDIHGRTFWKDILPFVDECEKIVFLGDYHDPYLHEGITCEQSIDNFVEIINFAKEHPDKVVLLLGNHDLSYYNRGEDEEWTVLANRFDGNNYEKLRGLFCENQGLFKMIDIFEMPQENRVFLFSHAGIQEWWINTNQLIENFDAEKTDAKTIYDAITAIFNEGSGHFKHSLRDISYYRGGYCDSGSMVWGDCHEFFMYPQTPYTQIFGHTQQLKKHYDAASDEVTWIPDTPAVFTNNVCVDCHKCFYIDEEGTIRDLNTDEEIY